VFLYSASFLLAIYRWRAKSRPMSQANHPVMSLLWHCWQFLRCSWVRNLAIATAWLSVFMAILSAPGAVLIHITCHRVSSLVPQCGQGGMLNTCQSRAH
jgi:hypothetical protein